MQLLLSLINLHTAGRTQVFVKQQNKELMMGFISFLREQQVTFGGHGDFQMWLSTTLGSMVVKGNRISS